MSVIKKKRGDKTEVKERVVVAARKAFSLNGIRTVTMDDIAASLSISKRTLYELFHDKEELLLEVVKAHRDTTREYMMKVASEAENVLEVILKLYQKNAEDFQNINRKFFEDLSKYPKVRAFINASREETAEAAIECFRKGVEQGIFRNDINYEIVRVIVTDEIDLLMQSEICQSYSLAEVYEAIVFMHMRGISTEKGRKIVDDFLLNLKGIEHNKNG